MKKYQIDWVQFAAALIIVAALVGAIVAMFAMPRAPWPVTFPLLIVAAVASFFVECRLGRHDQEGRK